MTGFVIGCSRVPDLLRLLSDPGVDPLCIPTDLLRPVLVDVNYIFPDTVFELVDADVHHVLFRNCEFGIEIYVHLDREPWNLDSPYSP